MSAFSHRLVAPPAGVAGLRPRRLAPVLFLVATLVFAMGAVQAFSPAPVSALSMFSTRCDGVGIRSKPSTTSTKLATLSKGIRVVAVDKVSGGSWKTVCGSTTSKGSSWYKLTVVNYKNTKDRFGLSAVYVASSLLKKLYTISYKQAACDGVSVRETSSTSGTKRASLPAGTKVTVSAAVTGGSWSATCAGKAVSGTTWYRIKEINGTPVSTLYGASSVYGASGLFAAWSTDAATTSPAPTATPTASPKASPSASPTASPSSSPSATPSSSPSASPSASPSSTYWEGIDVSHWQGTIDWTKVKGAGKKFVYLKATEDIDFLDNTYATNRAQAKAQGLKVGAYHFARPSTTSGDAVAEANWFIKNAAPVSGELLPVLDLEVSGGLTVSQLQSWVKAFMDRVYTLTGVRGAIYVSPSFWSNYMGNTTSIATAGYKVLWVAHWTSSSSPSVPANNWNGNGWTFWQYTSSGTVAGISGRVDLDRYRYTDWTKVLIP